MLFQIRASALLATNRTAEAAEDCLTGLQLVRLSQQIPDIGSPTRTQILLARSLQPIWEGVVDRVWTEAQLAVFQNELSRFNLLADYTNAIRRVVLANIEPWQTMASSRNGHPPISDGQTYLEGSVRQLQPQAWWLDHCLQLYQAGQTAIQNVDVAGGRVYIGRGWGDLDGLPVDSQTSYLFQQAYWPGSYAGSVVFAQTSVHQAIIACALERFRLAHGKYPETLDELLPKYLSAIPNDVVRGRPMLYENSSDGRFTLRSVGPNQRDDRKNPTSDDWLWSFPTNAPPAAATR